MGVVSHYGGLSSEVPLQHIPDSTGMQAVLLLYLTAGSVGKLDWAWVGAWNIPSC